MNFDIIFKNDSIMIKIFKLKEMNEILFRFLF